MKKANPLHNLLFDHILLWNHTINLYKKDRQRLNLFAEVRYKNIVTGSTLTCLLFMGMIFASFVIQHRVGGFSLPWVHIACMILSLAYFISVVSWSTHLKDSFKNTYYDNAEENIDELISELLSRRYMDMKEPQHTFSQEYQTEKENEKEENQKKTFEKENKVRMTNKDDIRELLSVLELPGNTRDAEKIKSQFRKLSKQYHPDLPHGNEEKFREVVTAYKKIQSFIH